MDSLSTVGLIASARDWADRALRAYVDEDHPVTLAFAAISLEHLAKATLCAQSPALLAVQGGRSYDSLLHLVGFGKAAGSPRPRTIGAEEALRRVRTFAPGLRVTAERLTALLEVRNGVLHAGLLSAEEERALLTDYVRASDALFEVLGVAAQDRWGEHADLVGRLVSASTQGVEHEVDRRIAAAKATFAELLEYLPEDARAAAFMARADRVGVYGVRDADRIIRYPCPACEQTAYVSGTTSVEWAYDRDLADLSKPALPIGMVRFSPDGLACGVCDLDLDAAEQVPGRRHPGVVGPTSRVARPSRPPRRVEARRVT